MPNMIVAPQPIAAEEGAKVLMQGGNAVDAAVTAGFVQGVISPHMCGIGGYLLLNLSLADRSEVSSIVLDAPALAGAKVLVSCWNPAINIFMVTCLAFLLGSIFALSFPKETDESEFDSG